MARTKNNQRSANRVAVDVGATGSRPASRGAMVLLAVCLLAVVWAVAMMTAPGRVGYYFFFIYAEFYFGVISLVSLSITIMVGLVATDRLVLSIRQRVLLQSTHRTTGVIAVGALFIHVWSKVVEQHIRLIDIFIPFLAPYNRLYVGFGTLSGLIMVLVMWTGIARSRFIGRGKPWMWRSIHAISYLMWPIALTHGLAAGRPAKPWVTVSYIVCIVVVLVGLAVRLSVSLNRKKDFSSTVTGGMRPVGKLVATAAPAVRKRSSRWDKPEPVEEAPLAVAETWVPASPFFEPDPALALDEEMDGGDYAELDQTMRVPRRRRPAPVEQFSAVPAYVEDGEYDDRPRGRRQVEDDDTRSFEPDFDDDEGVTPPRRRHYGNAEETTPRPRRRVQVARYDESRYDESADELDEVPVRRSARNAGEARFATSPVDLPRPRRERAEPGRHSRSEFIGPAFDEEEFEADETPTLVDMASRRARKAAQQEVVRGQGSRGARRAGRGDGNDELADDEYWSRLRGEAN